MYLTDLIDESVSLMPRERMVFINKQNLTVIGDIHADIETLRIVEKSVKGLAVFLGDYADRGEYPVECYEKILRMFVEGKALLLRGNHESTGVYPHHLPYQLREKYGEEGEEIYESLVKLWSKMPISAIVEGEVWFAHGGVPTKKCRIDAEGIAFSEISKPDDHTMLEIMWNDPWEREKCGENYNRGVMYFYGTIASEILISELNVKTIVRSHEPKKVLRVEQDGMVVTIGSCANPYSISDFAILQIDFERGFRDGFDLANKFGRVFSIYNV